MIDQSSRKVTFKHAMAESVFRDEDGKLKAAVMKADSITVLIFTERGPVTSREELKKIWIKFI